MNSCKEFALDDLMAIAAIPVTDYSPGTAAWQLRPVIPASGFAPNLANAITIGQTAIVTGGQLIPIVRASGKAKDTESDSVSGRRHSVSIQCEADDRESDTWSSLLSLERTPCHLLLTFRGGTRAFVQADKDSYVCEVERDGAKTSVAFKVQGRMGIQLITA